MTAATETMPEGDPTPARGASAALVIRAHAALSVVFLLAGIGLLGLGAAKLVWPDLLADAAILSYGRVQPMAINALVFGWLTVALIGVAYHIVPRAVGAPLAFPLVALANLLLMGAAVAAGVAGIGLGLAESGRLSAMPMAARGALVVSFLVTAVIVSATARRGDRSTVPLPAWFLVAAPWWLFGSQALGVMPGLGGLPGEIQSAYGETAAIGLWVVAACVGGGYYLISRMVPDAAFNPELGRIAFWSLGFTWVWTTGTRFQYGPTRDWFETLPVVFAAGLLLVALTIVTDMAGAMRGRWRALSGNAPLQLFAAGTVLFALVPPLIFAQSLRSVSAVVRFTRFESALDMAGIVGAFTLWTMALVMLAMDRGRADGAGSRGASPVVWPILAGAVVAVGSSIIGGLHQGLAWLATVQDGDRDNFASGFGPAVRGLAGADRVHVAGVSLVMLGCLLFAAWALLRAARRPAEPPAAESAPLVTNRLAAIGRGSLLVFVVGALGAFAIPALDADAAPSLTAERSRSFDDGSLGDRGRRLYVAEGCIYCHTQEVRAVVTDVGLGPVSVAGDYAFDPPGVAGYQRVGPDLAHAGSRDLTDSARWVRDHLVDPRSTRPWSTMPSYLYLSEDDLTAVAVYVAGLE